VTARINDIANLAVEERNHAVGIFLQWFISEQVEEEDTVSDVVGKLKLVGDGGGLFMLDRDLGTRVFTPPTDA
jgi:ferritin